MPSVNLGELELIINFNGGAHTIVGDSKGSVEKRVHLEDH